MVFDPPNLFSNSFFHLSHNRCKLLGQDMQMHTAKQMFCCLIPRGLAITIDIGYGR